MKNIVIYFLLFMLSNMVKGQINYHYSSADSLRYDGKMTEAINEYRKSYFKDPLNSANLYNFSCALSNDMQFDSSFKYLIKYVKLDTSYNPLTDPDFLKLRTDKRWDDVENSIIANMQKKYSNPYKDIEYCKKLWKMRALDQAYYTDLDLVEKKLGMRSSVTRAIIDLKNRINEENLKVLELLINEKGWPKISQVANSAAGAAFLVIQHGTLENQKKYLPTIKELCIINEASWQSYALMYDRIQTSESKPQKYGSQLKYNENTKKYELFPLEDEQKVDQWRKEMGMGPLSEYVAQWDLKFEPIKK